MSSEKEVQNHQGITRRNVLGSLGIIAGCGLFSPPADAADFKKNENNEELKVHRFESLVKAQMSQKLKPGEFIETSGYYAPGDGGEAKYIISASSDKAEVNGGDIIRLKNQLVGKLTGVSKINYLMFGAKMDAQSDDGISIKLAHDFANRNRLPVENLSGDFFIESNRNIEIKTPVNWGQSRFYINETLNSKQPVFVVLGYEPPTDLIHQEKIKNALIKKLKPGVQQIEELAEYSNFLFWVRDGNDRLGYRYGYSGQARSKEELFYVEEDGRIVGDIAWDFKNLSEITAYSAENSYLVIEGGSFFLSGEIPGRRRMGYFHNGFFIKRSRTIIRNQWMGLQPGKKDTSLHPRSGFYYFSFVYDTLLENIRLIPWEKNRPGSENDVHSGTYGIGGNRMLNTTFRNITAEGTRLHWGVFGTNMNKDFKVQDCRLNRIDVHFHCWNLTIKDSYIGNNGITLTGGGRLLVENTRCDTSRFISFRTDFGAKWDGNIILKNCTLRPSFTSETSIFAFVAADFNYGYPIGIAKSIVVDNFVFDYSTVPENNRECWLLRTSDFSVTSEGKRSFFPDSIQLKNISVQGREKGVRIMKISDPAGHLLSRQGGYNGIFFNANAFINIESVQLENIESGTPAGYHLQFMPRNMNFKPDSYSLYPRIQIKHCGTVSIQMEDATAEVFVENSSVSRFETKEGAPIKGELNFTGCRFIPAELNSNKALFHTDAELGTSFINCTFHLSRQPVNNPGHTFPFYGFMEINKYVRHNHLNSRLGKDILDALAKRSIQVKPEFLASLKNHHEME